MQELSAITNTENPNASSLGWFYGITAVEYDTVYLFKEPQCGYCDNYAAGMHASQLRIIM